MTKLATYLFAIYLLLALMSVLSVRAYADGELAPAIATAQEQTSAVGAQVHFRIRVSDKASLRIEGDAVSAASNAGNLYIVEGGRSAERFVSSDRVIELEQSVHRLSDGITLAVL